MTFWGLPSWLFWSAAAACLAAAVLLHFLRVRSRTVTVPTLLFWREALREETPRVLFRRLSRVGSLLLVLAVLLSLLLSAGEPGPSGEDAEYRVYLLDPAALLLPSAGREARAVLEKSLPGGPGRLRPALLLAGRICRPLATFQDPPRAVLGALEEMGAKSLPSREAAWGAHWEEALRTARALLEGRKKASVVALAVDPTGLPPKKALPGGIPLYVRRLPSPLWDDGLQAALPVRREDGRWDFLLRASRRGRGGPVRSLSVSPSAGEKVVKLLDDGSPSAEVLLRGLPPGAKVAFRLSGKDALGEDRGELVLPARRSIRVFCPSPGPVLEAALGALDWAEVAEDASAAQVAVIRNRGDLDRAAGLPALLLGAAAGVGEGAPASPWRPLSLHPLVEGLAFPGVRSRALRPGAEGGIPLFGNGEGPVIALEGLSGKAARILCAADPEERENGLAECPDFPRFLARSLRALSGIPFPEDGLPPGGWGWVRKGLDGGGVRFRCTGWPEALVPLLQGRGEWFPPGGGSFSFDGFPGPSLDCGDGPVAGGIPPGEGEAGGIPGGGPPFSFWLGLLGLFFLTLEWWAFNRGRAA